MKCVDAAFLTKKGILFTFVPLDLLNECRERRDELKNQGATSIVFFVNLEHENGRNYEFEASDIWVRVGRNKHGEN